MTTETKIDTGTDELLCVIRDRVAIITLNRPEARNSLSDNLTPALKVRRKLLARLKEDGDSLVMPGVPLDEREMLVDRRPGF